MSIYPNYPITYRQEVLSRLFGYIDSTESFYLVGAPSVGKTRLIDHLTLSDVRKYYLSEEDAKRTWIVRVDLNLLVTQENLIFNFFELILSSLLLESSNRASDESDSTMIELSKLDSKVIESKDALRAVRLFEFAIKMLCQIQKNKICFLLDEFDEAYQNFPKEIFALLRGIRDANKPYLCFALFLRTLPEKLRTSYDIESFYELFSRNRIGIGPYNEEDTLSIIQSLLERFKHTLNPKHHKDVAILSGGHPGLILALLRILIDNPSASDKLKHIEWIANQDAVNEECRKIWGGLLEDERAGLLSVARGNANLPRPTQNILYAKGLLDPETNTFFSPLFELYVKGM